MATTTYPPDRTANIQSPGMSPARDSAAPDGFDLQSCRTLMRGGSKTFFAASLLLPPRIRVAATALYAFCRVADDLIDDGEDKSAAMTLLRTRLDAIYRAQPQSMEADLALAMVVHQHAIPRALLDALLEGFEWDSLHQRYETIEDLHGYAARVASTVGAMMTLIMGVQDAAALSRACDLGVAMQLTNIARDVGEDGRAGRLYLPLQWMREEGIDPDRWLQKPTFDVALGRVVGRLLAEADRLYLRAEQGITMLPRDCQGAIRAAGWVYAEIGREVERRGMNSIDTRAVVSGQRKLLLLGKALAWPTRAPRTRSGFLHSTGLDDLPDHAAPLAGTRFLVQAALPVLPTVEYEVDPSRSPSRESGVNSSAIAESDEGAVVWMIDLFERREIRRRTTGRPGPVDMPWTANTGH